MASQPSTSTSTAPESHNDGHPSKGRPANLTTVIPEIDPELTASLLSPKTSHPHRYHRNPHHHHHHHHHHHRNHSQQAQPQEEEQATPIQEQSEPQPQPTQQQQKQDPGHLQVPQTTGGGGDESDTGSCASAIPSGTSTPSPAAKAAMEHTGSWQPRLDRQQSWDRQEYKHLMLMRQRLLVSPPPEKMEFSFSES
ncbi:hypothetical protein VTJ04DRAFT_5328 [Mycothermus thermophilus]|uniref:uncharacterized protein n=1 Tax=Humicola insolens TaxID=85995 RepID=UPI0037431E52